MFVHALTAVLEFVSVWGSSICLHWASSLLHGKPAHFLGTMYDRLGILRKSAISQSTANKIVVLQVSAHNLGRPVKIIISTSRFILYLNVKVSQYYNKKCEMCWCYVRHKSWNTTLVILLCHITNYLKLKKPCTADVVKLLLSRFSWTSAGSMFLSIGDGFFKSILVGN